MNTIFSPKLWKKDRNVQMKMNQNNAIKLHVKRQKLAAAPNSRICSGVIHYVRQLFQFEGLNIYKIIVMWFI